MILVFWNCRGLGSDTAVRALHGLIRNKRPSMIFLSETKMKDHRLDGVRRRMGFHYGVNVSPIGRAGGLSLWWDDSVEVQPLFSSKHIIDVILRKGGDSNWVRITGVYGTPYREDKAEFWEWMSSYFTPSDIPWLCAGDFNEFLWDHEKSGGVEVLYNRPRYLENFMQATNLWDLDFNGPAFTWHGMRHGHLVEERIDWALINGLWQDLWSNSLVTHGTVMGQEPGEILVRWTKKINDCKSSLIRWSRNKFKKRGHLIQELLHQLQELQRDWRSNIDVIKQKTQLVDELRAQEESYWMQRSRVRWLREGDANTNFFHNSTLQRRQRNQIIKIKDELGNWVEQPGRVRKLVEDHFMQTFTSGGARNWGSLLECISPRVTEDMNQALLKPVSEDEIKTAIFKMGGLKAPGPDGFHGNKFAPSRGFKQGDPLSPYLFIIMGEKVNLQKSSIYFGANVPKGVAANLGSILGVSVVDNPGTYLGVPAIWGHSKKRGLAYVKGRILGKLQGWKQSALSRVGREVLIKAVVRAIPAYPMCIFKFPVVVCQELDALVARFWWGSHGEDRKIHWVSKEVLGLPKDMGGLGFRKFQEFNDALLAKQCWRLLMEPNSLWARAKKWARASWAWSSLLSGRELLASGSHWQIMGGENVRVWVDRWLPSLPSGHPLPLGEVSVSSNLRQWDFDFLRPFLSIADQRAIQETIIGDSRWKDRLVWAANRNGKYSVKSGYMWLQVRSIDVRDHQMPVVRSISKNLWTCIWQLAVSLHLGLPTGMALFKRRLSPSPSCPLCRSADETVEHVFLRCPWVAAVWFGGALNYKVDVTVVSSNWGSSADRQWFQAYLAVIMCLIRFLSTFLRLFFRCQPPFGNFLLAVSSLGIARPVSVSREDVAVRWCPHSSPFVKINVDASWSNSSRMGFAGVVARQDGGRFMAAVRSSILAHSSFVAESFAILRGCELGASLGFSSVIIESDSLQAISCLNGSLENGSWEAFPILARAQRLGSAFQNCRWSWVPRSTNMAADVLASAGLT
ncbi:unnamed protein product [Malus baccata var. baccata]